MHKSRNALRRMTDIGRSTVFRWRGAALLLSIVAATAAITAMRTPRLRAWDLPTLAVPEPSAAGGSDSLVVLYYRAEDCFTCFGVLGYWTALVPRHHISIWLALDGDASYAAVTGVRRMRLPFRTGFAAGRDLHGRRPRLTVKEVLFVHGESRDSAIIRLGDVRSGLVDRLERSAH